MASFTDASPSTTMPTVKQLSDPNATADIFMVESEDETKLTDEVIAAVKESEEWTQRTEYEPSRFTFVRFVRGNKGNVARAVEEFTKMLKFRREEKVHEAGPDKYPLFCARADPAYVYSGLDSNGRPVIDVYAAKHDKNDRDIEEFKAFVIHTFESCTADALPDDRLCFRFHMEGFSVFKNMDYECVKVLVGILQNYYPETLHRAVIIEAPFVFSACWTIIKPWLDPVTVSKVAFIRRSVAENDIKAVTPPPNNHPNPMTIGRKEPAATDDVAPSAST